MALLDPYGTLAGLKSRLGILDSNDDSRLQNALLASAGDIAGVCGRQFNDAGAVSARVYYPDSPTLVEVHDFSTVTGLKVEVDYSNTGNYGSTIAAANYQVEPLNGIMNGEPGWPYNRIRSINQYLPLWWGAIGAPRASIQVTARWGWAAVPAAIVEANYIDAEELFKLKDAPFGIAGFSNFGAVRVRSNPKVMELLDGYFLSPIQAR